MASSDSSSYSTFRPDTARRLAYDGSMAIRLIRISALAALAASCARTLPPLHSTRLFVQESEGRYRPTIHAVVAGQKIELVVDTGAQDSVLPAAFVRRTRLPTRELGDLYHDANGQVFSMSFVPDVPIRFEGEKTSGKMNFVESPLLPEGLGILAPQALVQSGWALTIDLDHGELRYDLEEAAIKRLRDSGAPVREVDFHGCLSAGLFNKAHRIVDVNVSGVATSLLVDSGSETTALARNNAALPTMARMMGADTVVEGVGSQGRGLIVDDVPVEFAGTTLRVKAMVLPASQVCGQGTLGADILRQCTLIWGSSTLWASCRPQERAPNQ